MLAWEGERPAGYQAFGAVLAVSVAVMFGLRDNVSRAVIENVTSDALAQATSVMLGATIVLVPNLLRQTSALARFRVAFPAFVASALVTALAQATLFAALDRARVTVTAPLTGTGVLWTVVLAANFLGRSEMVGRRLYVVALLVVVGVARGGTRQARSGSALTSWSGRRQRVEGDRLGFAPGEGDFRGLSWRRRPPRRLPGVEARPAAAYRQDPQELPWTRTESIHEGIGISRLST